MRAEPQISLLSRLRDPPKVLGATFAAREWQIAANQIKPQGRRVLRMDWLVRTVARTNTGCDISLLLSYPRNKASGGRPVRLFGEQAMLQNDEAGASRLKDASEAAMTTIEGVPREGEHSRYYRAPKFQILLM